MNGLQIVSGVGGVAALGVGAHYFVDKVVPRARKGAYGHRIERLFSTMYFLRKDWGSEVHALADYGDLAGLKAHIEKHPEDVNKWAHGEQPIHVVTRNKHLEIVRFLVEKGANVNAAASELRSETSLHLAFQTGDTALIQYLLSKDANMYARDAIGSTPIEYGDLPVAKKYFKHFDFMTWYNGSLPIHDYAIFSPKLALAILPEICGINVPCPRYNHATALHLAVAQGREYLVRELLYYGAQLDAQDAKGNTPLHIAIKKGQDHLVKLFLSHGARIDIKDQKGRAPLDLARQLYAFNNLERFEERFYSEENRPWRKEVVGKKGEDGLFVKENGKKQNFTYLMDTQTKDLYELETSSAKLKFKAVLVSALAPLYLPLSMIRQVGALALDIARVVKDIFFRIRSSSLVEAIIVRPCKEVVGVLIKRTWHVAISPLFCIGLMFAGLYTQYDQNEGRKWMSRMAESWDESRLLTPFCLAKVGNRNMTTIGEKAVRQFRRK